jgi:Ger(x)C family germination protein
MKSFKLLAMLLCITLLVGCWDKVEIEDRLFVLGIGVDKATPEEKINPNDKLAINFASPIVGALKESGGGPAFSTYKTVAEIFTFGMNQLYERMDKKLSFQHTRILLFGEDLLKDETLFREVLDAIARSHDFHRNMYVFTVAGRTDEVFNVKPVYSKLLAPYIAGIAENSDYQSSIYKLPAYDMYNNLTNSDGNTVIPLIKPAATEVKAAGAGVIKKYKLVGYIDDKECETLNWLNNKAKGGIIEGEHQGLKVPFRYYNFKTTMKLAKVEGNKIYINYFMESEGGSEEYIWDQSLLDQKVLYDVENSVETNIQNRSKDLISKFQTVYKVDLIRVGDFLRKYHPEVYKAIEKDYQSYFENNIVVDVQAKAVIRRVGTIE